MPSKFKLNYFHVTGLGEPIRYLLSYGGIEFEDNRVARDKWPAIKEKFPLGKLPTLEVDGKILFQSNAINRYLATIVGLDGKTPLENWEIDAVVDTITDLRTKVVEWAWESDDAKKAVLKEAIIKEHVPFILGKLDSWTKENNGYLALGKLTWADLLLAATSDTLKDLTKNAQFGITDFFAEYPNLKALREKVNNLPGVKAWIEKRPPSQL